MSDSVKKPRKSKARETQLTPAESGLTLGLDGSNPPGDTIPQADGKAASIGQGNEPDSPPVIESAPIPGPSLRSRIDPASIVVDWDVEDLVDEDEKGPVAKWSRPPRDNFVRAHLTWTTGVYLLDCRESLGLGAEYVLARDVARRLMDEDEPVAAAQVYHLTTRDGGYLYWPVKLGDPAEQQKPSDHIKTAMAAIERARHEWVKITWRSRKGVNGWRTRAARIELPEPVWPEDPMALFLQVVSDRYIDDPNDAVIRKYLGEA
jgi:hypothetical protein